MIGKANSIAHGGQTIDYALNKENAQVIDKQGVCGENGTEIKQEFEVFQNLNKRAENKDISIVLSPEPKDGKMLTNADYREITKDFMDKMGLDKNQYIAIKHTDREHTHIHVVANRINHNGECYKDQFIGKKAQRAAEEVAHKKGLTLASNVEKMRKIETKQVRAELKEIHDNVMKHRPQNFGEYMQLMKANKVDIQPTINKQGVCQGFRMERFGQSFKASEVHRSIKLGKMITISNPTALALKTAKMALPKLSKGMGLKI